MSTAQSHADTVPVADELSGSHEPRHLLRRGLVLAVLLGALVALVLAVPSLQDVRHQLQAANGWWVAAGVLLEVGSCVSFVVVFRAFFDRVPARLTRRIAWVEVGSGALLPGGGVTSYALGGLLLKQAGMSRRRIIVRSGGVFWLTSAVNALALLLGAALLLARVGHGPHDFLRTCVPLLVVAPLTAMIAASPRLAARHNHGESLTEWITALVDGVTDAWRAARHPSLRLLGGLGYLGFDMAVLLCTLRGLGYHANCGALMLGYLLGYCATMIPVPAGVGVLEGGLGGALMLYGAPPAKTAAAVLIYHAIAFWIPSLGGLGAYAALARARAAKKNDRGSRLASAARAPKAVSCRLERAVLRHYGFELSAGRQTRD